MQHTMHLQSKWTSSIACALGSYWPPLFAITKKNRNLLTNINAGASIASQMAIPISCSNNRRISMSILEEKRGVSLENQTRSTP